MSQNTKNACPGKKTSIGGQALIEGIMMRGPETTSMAVRHVSGEIVLESWPTAGGHKPKVLRAPFIRGIFNFIDSLRYGYKCLMRSAELSGLEDEEEPPKGKSFKEYLVSPFTKLKSLGPIPKENSVTSIPLNFANIKCPSSWNRMIPPRISTASTIFIGFHSSFPVFIYGDITAR